MITASLTIGAQHSSVLVPPGEGDLSSGHHCTGRYTGVWSLLRHSPMAEGDLTRAHLPHRDKYLDLHWSEDTNDRTRDYLQGRIEGLDGQYEGMTQLQKYREMSQDFTSDYELHCGCSLVINTVSTHSAWALLNFGGAPMVLLGAYDPQLKAAYLVWSMGNDLEERLRDAYPLKYLLYRFPLVANRAVFIPTQAICAHWWRYTKTADPLFAFNALELKLFR